MNLTWLFQLFAVAVKEIRHTVRDRRMMAVLLIMPAIQLGVFGLAVDFDVDRVPTVVVDHDRTETSRYHLQRILADGTLLRQSSVQSDDEARRLIDANHVSVALVVPRGFGKALGSGRAAHIQVLVDGTDPNRGSIAANAVARYARAESLALQPTLLTQVSYNPRLRTAIYVVPGIIAMLLLVVTVIVTAMGLARERETGTLEQVMVTPMSAPVLLVGKLLPYLAIGLVDFLLAVVVASWLFDVPIRGNFTVALSGTVIYLVSTLGVGLFISTVSRNQQQAFIGGFLFLMPAILLSGVMTPLWGVPDWLEPLVLINPVKYYVEVIRGVLLRGAGFADLARPLAAMAVLGLFVLATATLRFRRSVA